MFNLKLFKWNTHHESLNQVQSHSVSFFLFQRPFYGMVVPCSHNFARWVVSSFILRYILLELHQSGVVLVKLLTQLSDTLLHLLVRFTLVLKHHFHKEQFALKEATLAHLRNCWLHLRLGVVHFANCVRVALSPLISSGVAIATGRLRRLGRARHLRPIKWWMALSELALHELLIKDATFLINLDDRCACVVIDHSSNSISCE